VGKLVLYFPDGSTREIFLTKERTTIGRRPDNDVPLPSAAVSAEHAAVVTVLDDSFLEDLGSTNGTFVNEKPVTKHFLRDRDRVDVGREILIYYVDDAAVPEVLPPELLRHDAENVLAPLDAHLAALADLTKGRGRRSGGGPTESRPVVAEFDPQSDGPMTGQVATEFDSPSPGEPDNDTTQRVRVVPPATLVVRVVDGPSAGREIALDKHETVLGRVGVAVVALRTYGSSVRLVPLESVDPPLHNGASLPAEGTELRPGDTFAVAGTMLTLAHS
jgi:FHA domain